MSIWTSVELPDHEPIDIDIATATSWNPHVRVAILVGDTGFADDIELTTTQARALIAMLTAAIERIEEP